MRYFLGLVWVLMFNFAFTFFLFFTLCLVKQKQLYLLGLFFLFGDKP
jgi:hypothetical protein